MAKLNLSKFKKTSSNPEFTILKHPAGHEIKISHKGLNPENRKSLDELPHFKDGGMASQPTPAQARGVQEGYLSEPSQAAVTGAQISSGVLGQKVAAPYAFKASETTESSIDPEAAAESGEKQTAAEWQEKNPGKVNPFVHGPGMAQGGKVSDPRSAELQMSGMMDMHKGGKAHYDQGGTVNISDLIKIAPLLAAMAKGGEVKDPTQQHLLPGDAIPNKIEHEVVNKARKNYADGTPDQPVSQDDTSQQSSDLPQDLSQQGIAKLGKDQEPNAEFLPSPDEPDSAEQIKADAQANAPTGPNAQYASLYQNELDQIRQNNPGQPDIISQQQALDAATRDKSALTLDSRVNRSKQQAAYNAAQVINQKKMGLGLPPDPMPQSPNQPMDSTQNFPQTSNSLTQGLSQLQQQQPIADPYGMNAAYDMWMKGMNERLGGIYKEAQATGQLGTNQAAILGQQIDSQKQLMANTQDQYNQLNQERAHMLDDLDNQQIDPERYMKNMSTGDKIKSTIGLMLGGFGALAGTGNLAYQALQNNINRDVEAQKSNLGKTQTMLSNNLQQFGNLRDAAQWQHIQSQDIIAHQLQQQAAAMAPGMAQGRALQLAGQLRQDSSQMVAQMGMRRSLMNLTQGSQTPQQFGQAIQMLRVMNPEMAKEMESRYVPGIGVAGVPVPQKVRDDLLAHQQLDSTIRDLHQFVNTHSTIIPGTADYNTGAQKAMALQAAVRESLLRTVYREGEQPLLDKVISSNPAGIMKSFKTVPQLNELLQSNMRKMNLLKQSVQLPTPGVGPGGVYQPKTFQKVK